MTDESINDLEESTVWLEQARRLHSEGEKRAKTMTPLGESWRDSQIDTSGEVVVTVKACVHLDHAGTYVWEDLTPFTQGYVEALLTASWESLRERYWREPVFSDVGSDALARMIADCETYATLPGFRMEGSAFLGQKLWVQRQANWPVAPFGLVEEYRAALPPLTVLMGDDGKVRFA